MTEEYKTSPPERKKDKRVAYALLATIVAGMLIAIVIGFILWENPKPSEKLVLPPAVAESDSSTAAPPPINGPYRIKKSLPIMAAIFLFVIFRLTDDTV